MYPCSDNIANFDHNERDHWGLQTIFNCLLLLIVTYPDLPPLGLRTWREEIEKGLSIENIYRFSVRISHLNITIIVAPLRVERFLKIYSIQVQKVYIKYI